MGLDIRMPIGLMFSALGVMLTLFGMFSDKRIYQVSLGMNINFIWGLVLLAFGIVMLLLSRQGMRRAAAAQDADANSKGRRQGS
jgi:hypothetical protein